MRLYSLAVILAGLSGKVSAATIGPTANLEIANQNISPDGFQRSASLAGGSFPGPVIAGNKSAGFSINVINNLNDRTMDLPTSIHWHGLFQKTTNYADGGAFVNQCPIIPGGKFSYQFSGAQQAGTFWYHSHYQAQYCDGVRGAFIIYDPNDPQRTLYDVDDETTIITLADWYHQVSLEVSKSPTPEPDSTLINGKGRYSGGPSVPLSVVNVSQGKRYRLRLISISCDPSYIFSIDGHQLSVIEVDGSNVNPLQVDSLQIFAGQRYSVILIANQLVGSYWMRAVPNLGTQGFAGGTNVAILRYAGAPVRDPTPDPSINIPQSRLPLKETDLHPLVPNPVPGSPFRGGADININLNTALNLTTLQFEVNGVTYTSPDVPVLLQIMNGVPPSQLLPNGSIYNLEGQKSVEISMPGGALGGPHPIYLHGHDFHVVRSAGSSTYNYNDPVIRDVVSMGVPGDNVTFRFFTDNPGPWFLHCHIDWHLERGFDVVFAEDVPDVKSQDITTPEWDNLCPAYNNFVKPTKD